ncbi:MAG: cytochrome b [Sphingomonas sp.]|jgi:cytochrome b561|uniref:cytochrome b n=1 Tax=Sphingomonas sp. TaxID=28214 RepID=UPI00356192C5
MTSLTFDADDFLLEQAGPRRFDVVTIALHWLTVLLLIGLFASIWSLASVEDGETAAFLLTLHRSLGVLLWITAVVRIGWRLGRAVLPPFPATMGPLQQWAARLSEYGLYALLLAQPLTGLAQSFTRGKPFAIFGGVVPAVMERDLDMTHLFHELHEYAAWLLLVLIALHILAAVFHRVVVRDEVLQSMLPWKQAETGEGRE